MNRIDREVILPGATIGILGGGQLGRMLGHAAQRLGYRVHVYEPGGPDCPAAAAAHREFNAPYEDLEALCEFARSCDVVTYEFENVASEPLAAIAPLVPLRPRPEVLWVCQHRRREKHWLREQGFPHARFTEVMAEGDLAAAVREIGLPCVAKTAAFGYDGKGQHKLTSEADVAAARAAFQGNLCVVEQWVDYACEVSVIVARGTGGELRCFPVTENLHTRHILDFSIAPARVAPAVAARAMAIATAVAERMEVVGLLAVEMFVTRNGEVLVNELAPRPHNSGHWTLDASSTTQFEQLIRAICGLPLGPSDARRAAAMVNVLGEAWTGGAPNWTALLADPRTKLHLYGKREPRAGRKMGHFTVLGEDPDEALAAALELKARFAPWHP